MAGFFGLFDYTKEGPGVPKDAPPKPAAIVFFEVFFRKFWNLVKVNIMFNIFNIPAIIVAMFMTNFLIQKQIIDDPATELILRFIIASFFLCTAVITAGPAQAGLTYIMRNYSREEHAFIWWDFKEHAIKNAKQSLIINLIDIVILLLVFIDINVYIQIGKNGIIWNAASGILIIAGLLFIMMHFYIYPMMVTFELKIKELLKNAFIFAIVKFIPNLIMLIAVIAILIATFWNTTIGFILYALITVSTINLAINFFVYPKLKKYIIDKLPERVQNSSNDNREKNAKIFEESDINIKDKKSQ